MAGGNAPIAPTGLPILDQQVALAAETSGTGVPAIAGIAGQRYWRYDTPATTNQRLYICTVAGAAGSATWVGIL